MKTIQRKNGRIFKIIGNWNFQSKQLKEKYAQLTEADLKLEFGKEDELLSRVETKLGKKRKEVIGIIKEGQPWYLSKIL